MGARTQRRVQVDGADARTTKPGSLSCGCKTQSHLVTWAIPTYLTYNQIPYDI